MAKLRQWPIAGGGAALLLSLATCSPDSEPRVDQPFVEAPIVEEQEFGLAKRSNRMPSHGVVKALVVFAEFKGENRGSAHIQDYADRLFNGKPGSLNHFFDTMSAGQLELTGTVLPELYVSEKASSAYLADREDEDGLYGEFALEILRKVDERHDLGRFDGDGDGEVDYVFINLLSVPRRFIYGGATGIAKLGFSPRYRSADSTSQGDPIHVSGAVYRGAILAASSYSLAVSTMAHEFAHGLGEINVPDLYDASFQLDPGQDPSADGAGIGRWGLMGLGTQGWNGNDGPNPFSAWIRERLGWIGRNNERLIELTEDAKGLVVEPVDAGGFVYRIPLPAESADSGTKVANYLLLEYRSLTASYYDRKLPGEGLLVWHVRPMIGTNNLEETKRLDLVCADGLFADAGFDAGRATDPHRGGDNLDYWAHDLDYTSRKQGNEGDATDPFDGNRYTRLDPDSNPSTDFGGPISAALTGLALRMERRGEQMIVDVRQPRWAGTIHEDVHWAGEIKVDGDLHIAEDGKLTVHAGTRVRFASEDRLREGLDPEKCELHISGDFEIIAQKRFNIDKNAMEDPEPVVFAAQDSGGTWYGIVADAEVQSRLQADSVVLRDVQRGLAIAEQATTLDDLPTAIDDETSAEAIEFELRPNYPNPFEGRTTIPYVLAKAAPVRLVVFNSLGQLVRTLVDEEQSEGEREVYWDGDDDMGRALASGVYLYLMEVPGHFQQSRKMLLLDGGLSQLLHLDEELAQRGRNWSSLQTELHESAGGFGLAARPKPDQVAFHAGIVWIRLQALARYGGDAVAARERAEQLVTLLRSFEPSPTQQGSIEHFSQRLAEGELSPEEIRALSSRAQDALGLIMQARGEKAAAFCHLGQWFEGLRLAAEAARQPDLTLNQVVDLAASSATARHLADYLGSLGAEETKPTLIEVADLLAADPSSRRELLELQDLLSELAESLTPHR